MKKKNISFRILLLLLVAVGIFLFFQWQKFQNSLFWRLQKVNLAIVTKDFKIKIISFEKKNSRVFNLSEKQKVTVPYGFGEYELGKVFGLGELEGKGGLLLKDTIQEHFGLPIFGYLKDDFFWSEGINSPDEIKRILWQGWRGKIQTDLKKSDLLILNLRAKKLSDYYFKNNNFDGSGSSESFWDKKIREESLAVEFLNGTNHSQFAQKLARMWENCGGRVVRIADGTNSIDEKCVIIANRKEQSSYSLWLMEKIFGCRTRFDDQKSPRTALTLVAGEGYWKKLTEKW